MTITLEHILDQDNFMAKHFAFDDILQRFFNISCLLDRMEFDKLRCSRDQIVNYEGNMLLDICKSNNLLILNGRCGKDRGTGAYTFKNTSIIDYSIASVEALNFVQDFEITQLDSLYSDGHALLTTVLQIKNFKKPKVKPSPSNTRKRPQWQASKCEDFVTNIDRNQTQEIITLLHHTQQNIDNVDKDTINNICYKIGETVTNSANKSFKNNNYKNNNDNDSNNKKWFGYRCQKARRKYHIARKVSNMNPSATNRTSLKQASNDYKK